MKEKRATNGQLVIAAEQQLSRAHLPSATMADVDQVITNITQYRDLLRSFYYSESLNRRKRRQVKRRRRYLDINDKRRAEDNQRHQRVHQPPLRLGEKAHVSSLAIVITGLHAAIFGSSLGPFNHKGISQYHLILLHKRRGMAGAKLSIGSDVTFKSFTTTGT